MSYLNTNREILLRQYPGLWEEINTKNEDDIELEDINVETAQTGDPVLRINGMYIHSVRDPLREGQRLAQSCEQMVENKQPVKDKQDTLGRQDAKNEQAAINEGKRPVVILGFGLGYAAQAAAKAAASKAAAELGLPIIVVEKHKNLLLKALELRDFSGFLGENRIIFVIGGSGEGITSALEIANELISGGNTEAKKTAPYVIRNRALTGFDEQWYKTVEDRIRSWTMKDDVNTATHKRFGRRWAHNLSRNMEVIRDYPGISHLSNLAAADEPLPVFLAAAGPSLDKIKPLLYDIYDRCIIVAVDTNLRFFVKNNIQPDFVLVVDPQFWNSRHLDRCVSEENSLKTALIAESAVYPPVLRLPFKNKFLCGSMLPPGIFIEKQVDPKGRLGAGGSVASTAWDFARALGANEIWIAGLDLAFPELKTHFRGARFEEIANSQSNRFNPSEKWVVRALRDGIPFKARSVSGGQIMTDRRLSLYASWFEAQFNQNKQIKNYSLFHDGLAIEGLLKSDSQKFLTLPKRREEIDRRIQQTFSKIETGFNAPEEKLGRTEKYEKAVYALTSGFKNIKTAAEEGAEIARRSLKTPMDSSQQNETAKKLDEITRRITESEVKEAADFLSASITQEENEESCSSDNDPFNAYLKQSLKLYSRIIEAAQFWLQFC
jgi:hypothetical protein